MTNYKLIAIDMDGTALNSKKEMDESTITAINQALSQGIEVVFCTGRCISEMEAFLNRIPKMRYLSGESGALLYDAWEKKLLSLISLDPDIVKTLQKISEEFDMCDQIMCEGLVLMDEDQYLRVADYQIGQYQESYRRVVTPKKDSFDYVISEGKSVEKVNLYHVSFEECRQTREKIEALQLPVELAYAEKTSLEISPKGITKEKGLVELCKILGITMEEVVMIGDAPNDLPALKAAGYAIAMGNAKEEIKEICDLVVEDNDHDGCAKAIEAVIRMNQ